MLKILLKIVVVIGIQLLIVKLLKKYDPTSDRAWDQNYSSGGKLDEGDLTLLWIVGFFVAGAMWLKPWDGPLIMFLKSIGSMLISAVFTAFISWGNTK